jgi:hypothetical protein
MVARISHSGDIQKVLNYNEQKVSNNEALLLDASGFLKDASKLTFYDKIEQFNRHISLNEKVRINTMHVSLNFDPSEKLSNDEMVDIATQYMDRIGFGYQPFLIYRHEDSGHPHLHIVTTNIKSDGSRISTHNLGRNESERARKELEQEYGLIKAGGQKIVDENSALNKVNATRVQYGKAPTKRAIANVLLPVLAQYKYTSLAELNALLGLYNVAADRGSEESRVFKNRGLLYRVIDEKGKKLGVPIKASDIWFKPTLNYLEKRFAENIPVRHPQRQRLKTAIDWALHNRKLSMDDLKEALRKEQVDLVVRQNKEGVVYGLTYIDHKTKCVFNGSDLGKEYSANAMMGRLVNPPGEANVKSVSAEIKSVGNADKQDLSQNIQKDTGTRTPVANTGGTNMLKDLFDPTGDGTAYVPWQLRKGKKKKKRKGRSQ